MLTPAEVHVLRMALLASRNIYNRSARTRLDWVRYVATTTKLRRELSK